MSIWVVHFMEEPDVIYYGSAKRAYNFMKKTLINYIQECNIFDKKQVPYYEEELEELEREYSAIAEDDLSFGANVVWARKEEVH